MSWSKEKVEKLSTSEIKSLMQNAADRGGQEIVELCMEVLSTRKQESPPRRTRVANSLHKILELQLDEQLIAVQQELAKNYDLSLDTAKRLSVGSSRFRAHEQLSSTGRSKTGDHQLKKRLKIDRYISYRIKDSACALACVQLGDDGDQVRFQVMGPKVYLDQNYKEPKQLRPYLGDDENLGAYEGGEEYARFEEAATRYKWLIEKVAPKK